MYYVWCYAATNELTKYLKEHSYIHVCAIFNFLKYMFSKRVTKIEKNVQHGFDTYLENVKSMVKIFSIFVAFLENMNFTE